MKNRRARALMVLGTASHVGKSITVAALCRIFQQDGLKVAPFKAQNMALNSFATREGHEIGRAQAVQAEAARVEPHVDMNPILLKPSSDTGAQVVLNGKVFGNLDAANYHALKPQLFAAVVEAYERLASRYDFIILEGAGSPVEMNLKDGDIVNLKMAAAADAACLLVADIDRGGVFASLVGTYALLTPDERRRFGGFVINKFRGDLNLLRPGVTLLEDRLAQPCLGVVPYFGDIKIDEEDSVALGELTRQDRALNRKPSRLRACVVQLPHLSNFSDFTAFESIPGVEVFYSKAPYELPPADIVILPGSKNTISDLQWLRAAGWADAIIEHASAGKPVIGICGGFQMLGGEVRDPFQVEGEIAAAPGLNLLDVTTSLGREKVTCQATARLIPTGVIPAAGVEPVFEGYEIHMGETILGPDAQPFLLLTRRGNDKPIMDGAVSKDGRVIGTYLHGVFDSPAGASALVSHLYRLCGKPHSSETTRVLIDRDRCYEELAAHFRRHLDVEVIYRLVGVAR